MADRASEYERGPEMSGDAKCPACGWTRKDHGMERQEPLCTGRAGCVLPEMVEEMMTEALSNTPATPPPMTDAATDALRRVRSGEAAGYMGPEVVILSRAQHDSDHEVVVRLRAENARLTTERDEAKAHHVRWVEEVDADLAEIEANMDQQDADPNARDVAMVKAGIEAAAKLHDDHADRLAESARRYRANTGEPDGPRIHAAEDHRENAKAIRAIDAEAVLKAMEGGR